MIDDALKPLLSTLTPSARQHLRNVLIRDVGDRAAIASTLMRYRDQNGQRCKLYGWPQTFVTKA
jgi:hypothetical protein